MGFWKLTNLYYKFWVTFTIPLHSSTLKNHQKWPKIGVEIGYFLLITLWSFLEPKNRIQLTIPIFHYSKSITDYSIWKDFFPDYEDFQNWTKNYTFLCGYIFLFYSLLPLGWLSDGDHLKTRNKCSGLPRNSLRNHVKLS